MSFSEKRALLKTDRRFAKIEDLLIEIGGIWSDENQYLVNLADELLGTIRDARAEVPVQVESLRQECADRAAEEAEGSLP